MSWYSFPRFDLPPCHPTTYKIRTKPSCHYDHATTSERIDRNNKKVSIYLIRAFPQSRTYTAIIKEVKGPSSHPRSWG